MPFASRKPPRNSSTIGCAYGADVSAMDPMPRSGNATSGTSEVAAMGSASVIHQTAITSPTTAVRHPVASRPSGGGRRSRAPRSAAPPQSPRREAGQRDGRTGTEGEAGRAREASRPLFLRHATRGGAFRAGTPARGPRRADLEKKVGVGDTRRSETSHGGVDPPPHFDAPFASPRRTRGRARPPGFGPTLWDLHRRRGPPELLHDLGRRRRPERARHLGAGDVPDPPRHLRRAGHHLQLPPPRRGGRHGHLHAERSARRQPCVASLGCGQQHQLGGPPQRGRLRVVRRHHIRGRRRHLRAPRDVRERGHAPHHQQLHLHGHHGRRRRPRFAPLGRQHRQQRQYRHREHLHARLRRPRLQRQPDAVQRPHDRQWEHVRVSDRARHRDHRQRCHRGRQPGVLVGRVECELPRHLRVELGVGAPAGRDHGQRGRSLHR